MFVGSVRKAGAFVRITALLVDGRCGGHLWAERYNRTLEDIFAVRDDVTEKIVRALEIKLIGTPQVRKHTENRESYDCVLRARKQYRLFTNDGNRAARFLSHKNRADLGFLVEGLGKPGLSP